MLNSYNWGLLPSRIVKFYETRHFLLINCIYGPLIKKSQIRSLKLIGINRDPNHTVHSTKLFQHKKRCSHSTKLIQESYPCWPLLVKEYCDRIYILQNCPNVQTARTTDKILRETKIWGRWFTITIDICLKPKLVEIMLVVIFFLVIFGVGFGLFIQHSFF